MSRKLGIIAGGSSIPKMLIDSCKKQGIDYFVLAIKGDADEDYFDETIPHAWIRIGQAGTGFELFKKEKVQDVVMIGTIKRPTLKELVPDFKTATFFAKIASKALGDDGILRALVNELEQDGMMVKGVHEVMPEILIKKGNLTKNKPDKQAKVDIKRGIEVALEIGRLDIGQSVIVQQGLVLGVEGVEGTDELIRRCGTYKRRGEGGVLVKLRKPQQDMRIDLPTIGIRTIENAIETGLRGIVVHAENGLIIGEEEAIKLANKKGLFVLGIDPKEYE